MGTTTGLPWDAGYPGDVAWAAEVSTGPMHALMDASVSRWAGRPAINFLGKRYSYAELGELVNRAARGFQDLGVTKGTRVGLCLPNSPYSVICYYAVLKAGGTVVNYNPLYVERELAHQIDDSGTEIMVAMDLQALYPRVAAMLTRTQSLKRIVVCSLKEALPGAKGALFGLLKRREIATPPADAQHIRFADLVANDGDPAPVAIDQYADVAVIQYTGGTTGLPKGAMLSHANLTANVSQILTWFPGMEYGTDKILGVLPFFHVFAMTVVMNQAVAAGLEMILLPRFDLKQTLKCIHKTRPTIFPGVPTIYAAILQGHQVKKYDLGSIKFCLSGGAPLPLEIKHAFERLTGCRLVEGYGLSETSPVATCNPINGVNKEGSIGLPMPGTHIEIRDLEEPGRMVPTGQKGEVCIVGPQVMKGYWDGPEETAEVLRDGGRLHTGDVGYMDEEGYTFLVDRIKDLILCSGYNVYPRVIEEAIYLHPSVAEVIVIGIDDAYRGQSPKAFVKLRDDESLTEEEMLAFLKDKLSKIEMPEAIEFRAELPKTMIGKLSKKELVAEEKAKAAG